MALHYISFWKYYTLRYKNSEGLSAAHIRTDMYIRKDFYGDRLRHVQDRDLKN